MLKNTLEKAVRAGANELRSFFNAKFTISNKEGEIFLLDNVNFGIRSKGYPRPLLPCNLPAALQKTGKQIIFSGAIKETKPEELWAGEPFVLTKAEEK